MKTFKLGGIHPPENKLTADMAIRDTDLPRRVVLSMSQHIGKPAKPTVKRGEHVKRGDRIGEADGFVSANIHTPISGTVKSVDNVCALNGRASLCVTVEADDNDHFADLALISDARPVRTEEQVNALSPKQITDLIAGAGIVGLGGATFPTHVKLTISEGKHADILIANGAECEPYLTCDNRIMIEQANEIAAGVELLRRACGAPMATIAIEANKPQATTAITRAIHPYPALSVTTLRTKYPQGGEKQLIAAITGREVPDGALPIDAGAVVDNVATALATYHAIYWGIPLIERVMTIAGTGTSRGNFRVPVGTDVATLLQLTGGIPENVSKIIGGGPMMGPALSRLDAPTTKGLSGILMMPADEADRGTTRQCIRCARCIEVCPMGLEPYLIATYSAKGRIDDALGRGLMSCIECGSCSYTCPSWLPLVDYIRIGKSQARRKR